MEEAPELDEQLLKRMEIIKPLIHLKPIPWDALCQQAQKAQCSPRTLRRWIKNYHEEGISGLKNKSKKRTRSYKQWESFIRKHYLMPNRPSLVNIYRKCATFANQQKVTPPSYSTVKRIIHDIPISVKSYHRNRNEFRDKYQVTGELYQATYPCELYLIDHRQLDVLVKFNTTVKAKRPWITLVLDQYSRAIVGYYLGFEPPSSCRVALALRHAILPKNLPEWPMCGIPTMLRHDHGKDLVSQHIKQVKLDLQISNFPKEKGNPRGNSEIERINGTMASWEKALPGWTGNSIKERPQVIHPKLTLTDLDKKIGKFILEYHRKQHSTIKMTPFDRWNTGIIPRLPESEASLDLLLLPVARHYKIRRDGIHFQTNRFWSDEFLAYIGETAILRYNPMQLDEIMVYVGNKRIGTAIRVSGQRQQYNAYRKKRGKQSKLMEEYKKQIPQNNFNKSQEKSCLEPTKTETGFVNSIDIHQQVISKKKKKSVELKLFPNREGEDWC